MYAQYKGINMNKVYTLLVLIALTTPVAHAVEGEHYTTAQPANAITKADALIKLINSKNEAEVYKCVRVEANLTKATIRNK